MKAAIEVVARNGFHGATVDAIARRAGYSTGALYWNFHGKDELFLAVFDEHVRWFEDRVAEAFAVPDAGAAAASWLNSVMSRPQQFLIFVEFWTYAIRRPTVRAQFANRMAQMRSVLAEAISARAEATAGTPQLESELVATVVLASGRGLALEKLADARGIDEQPMLDLLAALVG